MDNAGSVKSKLISIATVRHGTIELEDETIHVREIGTLEFAEYGRLLKTNRVKATAALIAACVLDGPDGLPMLTEEEALQIASSARASMPIINKVMQLSGFRDDAEEASEKEPDAS